MTWTRQTWLYYKRCFVLRAATSAVWCTCESGLMHGPISSRVFTREGKTPASRLPHALSACACDVCNCLFVSCGTVLLHLKHLCHIFHQQNVNTKKKMHIHLPCSQPGVTTPRKYITVWPQSQKASVKSGQGAVSGTADQLIDAFLSLSVPLGIWYVDVDWGALRLTEVMGSFTQSRSKKWSTFICIATPVLDRRWIGRNI